MKDSRIVDLYWERSEAAIAETAKKYGGYCRYIAYSILHNIQDSEECVNSTFLNAWNSIPPHRPSLLKTFLGKLTRNLSLNRYRQLTADKRGGGQVPLVIDELRECLPSSDRTENVIDDMALADILSGFLESLSGEQRRIFMGRYWYLNSVKEIARRYGMGESKVKMSLLRSRKKLKELLEKEGISL